MPSCAEIAAVVLEHEEKQADISDADQNICIIGRTIIAHTHACERVALLEYERVRFVGCALPGKIDVALIERPGAPLCTIPTCALGVTQ